MSKKPILKEAVSDGKPKESVFAKVDSEVAVQFKMNCLKQNTTIAKKLEELMIQFNAKATA